MKLFTTFKEELIVKSIRIRSIIIIFALSSL
ncbi:unnamed protein product [Acanthoscelides obtectus]|uniref:Uncharacterized protein n=1 Tax=Acanthoscelides obtectus TaxID=200917 RepID=A0A9P0PTG6_ACAOB|nr:unnamed protein product [Acanthoscelides obtectus]CAK1633672.1 hypothetical protein AOBTE_LOCUS8309 [Acanthoscelides obtectus]